MSTMKECISSLIPDDWKHIDTLNWNFSKNPLKKTLCYNNKGTRKVKVFQKISTKESLQTDFSNLYFMFRLKGYEETIFSVLILGKNLLLIGLSNAMIFACFLSAINLSIFLP